MACSIRSDEELAAQPGDFFVGEKQIVGKSKIREEDAVVASALSSNDTLLFLYLFKSCVVALLCDLCMSGSKRASMPWLSCDGSTSTSHGATGIMISAYMCICESRLHDGL